MGYSELRTSMAASLPTRTFRQRTRALLRVLLHIGFLAVSAGGSQELEREQHIERRLGGAFLDFFKEEDHVALGSDKAGISTDLRIVGGTAAPLNKYPFFVNTLTPILCGATLIHPDIVLSAAHCEGGFVSGVKLGGLTVNEETDGGQFLDVDRELLHPEYDDGTRANDIMLAKLSEPSSVAPVTLNFNSAIPAVNDVLTVAGYGDTEEDGDPSDTLLEVNVTAFADSTCLVFRDYIPDTMMCAGVVEGGRDSCQGDSGGPLFTATNVQVGIVSTGSGCARPNTPAIYTEVSAYETWIRSEICNLSDVPPASCSTSAPVPATSAPIPATSAPVPATTSAPVPATSAPVPATSAPISQTPVTSPPSIAPVSLAPVTFPTTSSPSVAPVSTAPATSAPATSPVTSPTTSAPTIAPTVVANDNTRTPVTASPTRSPVTPNPTQAPDPTSPPSTFKPTISPYPSTSPRPTPLPNKKKMGMRKGSGGAKKSKSSTKSSEKPKRAKIGWDFFVKSHKQSAKVKMTKEKKAEKRTTSNVYSLDRRHPWRKYNVGVRNEKRPKAI